jgi:protein TonB
MKKIPILLLCICSLYASAQSDSLESIKEITSNDSETFEKVEFKPEYPGGNATMANFTKNNLRYPKAAIKKKIQGVVYVQFIVGPDGSISDVTTIRGISRECDMEAERLVMMMPRWRPGQSNGENVSVRVVLPITFKGRPGWSKN